MNKDKLMNEILAILYQVKESKEDLEKILDFLFENIIFKEEPELNIPEEFKKAVNEISDSLECGFTCLIDKKTAAIVSVRRENEFRDSYFSGEEEEEEEEEMIDNWENIITIDPLESSESFRIMEDFALSLKEGPLKRSLSSALQRNKPFANFNAIIHNSLQKTEWFSFRRHAYEQHVAAILIAESVWQTKN